MSKNTRNRILLTAVAALLLVAVTVGGTMAWLQATSDPVTNTFTTSDVIVDIEETDSDDEDTDADNNSYKMIPGGTITKDPKVSLLTGSEDAWIFVKVTESSNLDTYIAYEAADGWISCGDNVWVYNKIQSVGNAAVPFLKNNQVTVLDTVDVAAMTAAKTDIPSLTFTPYAIQSANLSVKVNDADVEINEENIATYAAQVWALLGVN